VTTVTNPYGTLEHTCDISAMIAAAGAAYVARWTTWHPRQMSRSIKRALEKRGFSMVEIISQCPVQYGKVTRMGKSLDIFRHYKENSVRINKAEKMDADELADKIVVGEFVDVEKPELADEWLKLRTRLSAV
jgi:2-oxoglutarate ferredoxin oxidoreductase subunit beta